MATMLQVCVHLMMLLHCSCTSADPAAFAFHNPLQAALLSLYERGESQLNSYASANLFSGIGRP